MTERYDANTALLSARFSGIIEPAQLVANTNDWAPAGIESATVVRFTTSGAINLTGIAGGSTGRLLCLVNDNAAGGSAATIVNESASSVAGNRFLTGNGHNQRLGGQQAFWFIYDSVDQRWRLTGLNTSEAAVATVGTTNAAGTSADAAKRDHVHANLQHSHDANTAAGGGDLLNPATFSLPSDVSNATTGQQDNLTFTTVTRFNNASPTTITGLASGADGRFAVFYNQGTSFVTVAHQHASSSSFNRFDLGGQDAILYPGMALIFIYPPSGTTMWHAMGATHVQPEVVMSQYTDFR